jgi:phosphatidylinositol alpha-1,6-mannosyltransferase
VILITTQCFPPDRGGLQILMAGLAEHLQGAGEDVRVFADRTGRIAEPDGAARPSYRVTRFGGPRPLRRRLKAFRIARLVRSAGAKAVIAESWKSLESLPRLAVPVVVLAHGAELPSNPSPKKRQRIVRALSKASRLIANSAFTADLLRQYVPEAADRIMIINPPIAPPQPPSAAALETIRKIVDGRTPVLATLCRLEPRKGVDSVLRALAALAGEYPDVAYLVAGSGDDLPRLKQLAQALAVSDRVAFLGSIDEDAKAAMLASADLFVMPVRKVGASVEGFGLSFIEAAAYGAPSVAGSEGGAADAVAHGLTGLVCNGSDQEQVTEAIRSLLDDPERRRRMGEAAALRVRSQLLWAQATPRYLAALKPMPTDAEP